MPQNRQPVDETSSPIYAGVNGETFMFTVTVTTTATRLGTLITIPSVDDIDSIPGAIENYPTIPPGTGPLKKRAPRHVYFQAPVTLTNKVWLSIDNVTTPVAANGGPGIELAPGTIYAFENAQNLLTAKASGAYQVNAATAFQLVSVTGNQAISVWFCD